MGYAFYLLLINIKHSQGIFRNQIKYLLIGSSVGWVGGELQYLPNFGLDIYWALLIGVLCTTIYPFIITYGIIKYRLMDIRIAISRTGVFIAVYSLVLGIPFALAFGWQEELISLFGDQWWVVPLISLARSVIPRRSV